MWMELRAAHLRPLLVTAWDVKKALLNMAWEPDTTTRAPFLACMPMLLSVSTNPEFVVQRARCCACYLFDIEC